MEGYVAINSYYFQSNVKQDNLSVFSHVTTSVHTSSCLIGSESTDKFGIDIVTYICLLLKANTSSDFYSSTEAIYLTDTCIEYF